MFTLLDAALDLCRSWSLVYNSYSAVTFIKKRLSSYVLAKIKNRPIDVWQKMYPVIDPRRMSIYLLLSASFWRKPFNFWKCLIYYISGQEPCFRDYIILNGCNARHQVLIEKQGFEIGQKILKYGVKTLHNVWDPDSYSKAGSTFGFRSGVSEQAKWSEPNQADVENTQTYTTSKNQRRYF